jgi:hypothetical protein
MVGAYGKPHPSGCGFLAYGLSVRRVVKINLILLGNFVG